MSNAPPDDEAAEARARAVTTALVAAWMGERYYRTFRPAEDAASAFDTLFAQRDRRIGVSCGLLWEGGGPPGASELEELLKDDLEGDEGGYVVWAPPGGELPWRSRGSRRCGWRSRAASAASSRASAARCGCR